MTEASERPDPDALLRRVQDDEARARRGKLKLFFGFAPGVGKTYRMLQVAHELVAEQGLDVVVGIVEDHARRETAALVSGLEVLPRRELRYRGQSLDEFDLDLALRRRPRVLLVDELAHTNAPGSRHAKRWQDVEELLAAGIDVFTTMNVQHVESLHDVIAQITHVPVRETVPDHVLDRADAIELIDIAPEELTERLREGKVYVPAQAKLAISRFFQRGNLLALRELALRRTAQHVGDDVQQFREAHGVTSPWPAGERILVCVGPSPSSARLVRTAARMAAGLRCAWVASYVDVPNARAPSAEDRARLESHLRLAESLGAGLVRLPGASVAQAVLEYARRHNVTRIVVGKPTHSRLLDRLRGSLLDELVRGSGEIEVHVVSGGAPTDAPPAPGARGQRAARADYAWAAALVGVTTGVAALGRSALNLPDLEMLYLLAVMVTAVWFGRGPALLAAALAVATYDFLFVEPLLSFAASDGRYLLTFAMMLAVGVVMSELASRLRERGRDAVAREERTAALYGLTRELATTESAAEIGAIVARHAVESLAVQAFVLVPGPDAALTALGAAPEGAVPGESELGVARWTDEHQEAAGAGTDTLPGAKVLCVPLRAGASRVGVLALAPRDEGSLGAEQRAFLDVFGRQAAISLERARLSREAKQAELRARTEEMHASLLSSVSHDLRTPLAVITGAATSLRGAPLLDEPTRAELVDAIVDEAERMERLVTNILDMTRLESGALSLAREWAPIDDMISSALTRLEARLTHRQVSVSIAPDVPLLLVDPVLFEQVLVNLLENAAKYTPDGSPLELRVSSGPRDVTLELRDHGPGIPAGAERQIFEKFSRGDHRGVTGAGLGLAICKGIVEAHGGAIRAHNPSDGGAAFVVTVPRAADDEVVP